MKILPSEKEKREKGDQAVSHRTNLKSSNEEAKNASNAEKRKKKSGKSRTLGGTASQGRGEQLTIEREKAGTYLGDISWEKTCYRSYIQRTYLFGPSNHSVHATQSERYKLPKREKKKKNEKTDGDRTSKLSG